MYKGFFNKLHAQRSTQRGATLTDIMIGAALTGVLVSGSGAAIASMMDASATATAKSERRVEMNRALDFMSMEVNRADSLIESPTDDKIPAEMKALYSTLAEEIDTSTITPTLMLTLQKDGEKVVYFTATPESGTWKGPKVLYRWGPSFDQDGQYTNMGSPSEWEPLALLDRLEGFTATVSGETAQLNPVGKIQKLLNRSESYSIVQNSSPKSKSTENAVYSTFSGAQSSEVKLFTVKNGKVTLDMPASVKVEFLGGDITCGAGGGAIPTSATVKLTDGTSQIVASTATFTKDVASGTKMEVTGLAKGNSGSLSGSGYWQKGSSKIYSIIQPSGGGWQWKGSDCSGYSFEASSVSDKEKQVLTLINGDTVPAFTPVGGQRSIDTFLQSYIEPKTGKVKIADNQVIYLYELGTTNSSSSAYDMQDLVVLATINPSSTSTSTTPTTTTTTTVSGGKCNNGLGDGSDGCTPGKARPNDEVVRDAYGNVVCQPKPGTPCTKAAKANNL